METKVLTCDEFKNLIYDGKSLPKNNYSSDLENIRYFSFDDLKCWFANNKYCETLRFVVCYDRNHIYGVLKFAWFSSNNNYSISYCSTNNDYKNTGICKTIIKIFCEYFSFEYPSQLPTDKSSGLVTRTNP